MSGDILVLEDDFDFRELIEECLEDAGYKVRGAESGDEAVRLVRQRVPQLIISDVRMKSRDGIETVRLLRREYPGLKSIIITGYADDDAPSRAIQVEAEDYIYKPFALKDLLKSIERVLTREEEKSRYGKIFGALGRGLQKLKERAANAVVEKELRRLDLIRDKAFLSFYMGIRSKMLSNQAGHTMWSNLYDLEGRRTALLEQTAALAQLQELSEALSRVADLLAAATRKTSVPLNPTLLGSPFPEDAYLRLRKNITSGRLSSEQLKLAPFLWSLDESVRRQSQDLIGLHDLAWGTAS